MIKLKERKILKGTHWPMETKEILQDMQIALNINSIYLYLTQNK